ncbi:MAG: thiamine-phosphate kinase [Cyanobacteria bacterium P01_H01_bin.119]
MSTPHQSAQTVKDLGESGLLTHLKQYCPPEALSDDGALLLLAPGKSAVVTTDMLVDGVHFSDRTTSAFDVGWRATAANLSDLAAMGAEPIGITIALGLPGETPLAWVDDLYQGVTACLQAFGGVILGGDICRAPQRTVSITATGQLFPIKTLRRGGGQPGYRLVTTGVHGAARAGLEILLNPDAAAGLPAARQMLIEKHQRPRPRFDVLPQLWACCAQAAITPAIAAMDSSDGLADAVVQLCQMSGTGATLQRSRLPIPEELHRWRPDQSPNQILEWTLYGGEDFELVLAMPDQLATAFVEAVGAPACIFGEMTRDRDIWLIDDINGAAPVALSQAAGFQHFG